MDTPALHEVDWSSYAQVYDLMSDNNPAYGAILADFEQVIERWDVAPGDRLVDLGAGTGNFSLRLARRFTQAEVLHLDSNSGMNTRALFKAETEGGRISVLEADADRATFAAGSLGAVVSVHSLYTLADPRGVIRRMFEWLRPGGHVFACDLGRRMDVLGWSAFLARAMVCRRGVLQTARTFVKGRAVASQNRAIRKMQDAGHYWLHSGDEFVAAFVAAGFRVERSSSCYRGCSDLVVATKP
jgi:ubiquinone/menaquinone biosynthesis C-methylase UbiE